MNLVDDLPGGKKISYYINFCMALIYFTLGLLFLFTKMGIDVVTLYRTPAGIIFILYAVFRFYTTYKKMKLQQ